MLIISITDVNGVSQLIEPENASNNSAQRRGNNDCLWMIMKRVLGYSLKEFIERKCQGVLDIPTAIQLTLNLVRILQQVHKKRIFHLNLSPENIMIEWDLKLPIGRAQLTILNFSQGAIVSNRTHTPITSSPTQKWYHAPQIDDKGMSSTIDPSGICAILFWLLTRIDPRHENDELPHQQAHDKLNDMIKSAAGFLSMHLTL
jgi:serine/threonine protein kinase